MSASEESIALLRSIDASLKEILALSRRRTSTGSTGPAVASDKELDSQYGDPIVKAKSPRDWSGQPMLNRKFSECPPEYLDLIAARFDYFAQKAAGENDKTKEGYARRDARRARGWAARIRAGKVQPKIEPQSGNGNGDDWATGEDSSWG